jgi:hypothetical protein
VVKRPGREADHSPPSSAELKEWVELYLHSPNTPTWRGAQLRHRDRFLNSFMLLYKSVMFLFLLLVSISFKEFWVLWRLISEGGCRRGIKLFFPESWLRIIISEAQESE